MKNNINQQATLTRPLNKSTLNQILKDLMLKRVSVGVITLKEFINKTGCSISAAVEFLKGKNTGDFINGRQGHPSRFVFGEAQEKWIHQEVIRADWRKTNGRDPITGTLLKPVKSAARQVVKGAQRMIAVTVGDETVKLPLSVEMVA